MNGYGGTTTFGPNDALTRGQVAVVLFNMSGAVIPQDETNAHYNTESGWNTGFSDVDGKQYYGQAIYWAKKTGVVGNGYVDGSFRPDQTITREQFAGMLANYAKARQPRRDRGHGRLRRGPRRASRTPPPSPTGPRTRSPGCLQRGRHGQRRLSSTPAGHPDPRRGRGHVRQLPAQPQVELNLRCGKLSSPLAWIAARSL